jgi:hypothetical protein
VLSRGSLSTLPSLSRRSRVHHRPRILRGRRALLGGLSLALTTYSLNLRPGFLTDAPGRLAADRPILDLFRRHAHPCGSRCGVEALRPFQHFTRFSTEPLSSASPS